MIRYHKAVHHLLVPTSKVFPNPRNDNNGDVDNLISSLLTSGCYRPIYTEPSGQIVAGHTLYAALLELGEVKVPRLDVDASGMDALRILVADNQIARLARPDRSMTRDLLGALDAEEKRLLGTGFGPDRLENLDDELAMLVEKPLREPKCCPHCGGVL